MDERIEVRSLLLPGREQRFAEPALPSLECLAELIAPAISCDLDGRFAIFGHSMGALLGYEVAQRLAVGGYVPVHLFASGARAPHVRHRTRYHELPDVEFIGAVRDLGGMPPELAGYDELLALMLPTLRADFRAAEAYRCRPRAPLPCPITVFGGMDDPLCTRADLDEWMIHTESSVRVHLLPGGHFFVATARDALLHLLEAALDLTS